MKQWSRHTKHFEIQIKRNNSGALVFEGEICELSMQEMKYLKKTNSSWKIIGWNWKILRKNIAIILQYINNLQQIADNKICSHQYFIPPLLFFLTCKTALVKNDACATVCVCVCKPLRVSVCGIFLYLRRLKPPISHPGWWGFYNLSDLPTVDCSEPVTDAHRLL